MTEQIEPATFGERMECNLVIRCIKQNANIIARRLTPIQVKAIAKVQHDKEEAYRLYMATVQETTSKVREVLQ